MAGPKKEFLIFIIADLLDRSINYYNMTSLPSMSLGVDPIASETFWKLEEQSEDGSSVAFWHSLHDTAWRKAMNLSPLSSKMSLIQCFRKNSKYPRGICTSWPRKSGETPTESTTCGDEGKDEKGMRRRAGRF